VLTASAITATNAIGAAPQVVPVAFTAARLAGGKLSATLPAKSVVMLRLQ
jgi:alpha-N-arabinofuranosidase